MSEFLWYPERLDFAILAGFRASLAAVQIDAAHAGSTNAGAVVVPTGPTSATLKPTGIGAIEEEGAVPHEIAPGTKGVLYLKGLDIFAGGPVMHPGREARPYLHPAAARWANGGFQNSARATLDSQGF